MDADAVLAWETIDPARLRTLLGAVGFRVHRGGACTIPGLVLALARSAGHDRLRLAARPGPGNGRRPAGAGRDAGADSGAGRDATSAADSDTGGVFLRAVAVATVDLERAAAAFGGLAGELPDDALLGARVAQAGAARVVLAEPRSEGRLAATLARHGEGPAALYVAVAPAALDEIRSRLARLGEHPRDGGGPFGVQILARTLNPWGPHLLLVPDTHLVADALLVADAVQADRSFPGRSATIAP